MRPPSQAGSLSASDPRTPEPPVIWNYATVYLPTQVTKLLDDFGASATRHHFTNPVAVLVIAERDRAPPPVTIPVDRARMVTVTDLGQGTVEMLQEAAELLCRAYPSAA